jgi:hypothetical protein
MWREGAADVLFEATSLYLQPDKEQEINTRLTDFLMKACDVITMMHTCDFSRKRSKPLGAGATVIVRTMATHVRTMATHVRCPDLLVAAMMAVTKITLHHTVNADVLGEPCVKLCFDAVHAHENNEAVVNMGLQALAAMAKSSSDRKTYMMHELWVPHSSPSS